MSPLEFIQEMRVRSVQSAGNNGPAVKMPVARTSGAEFALDFKTPRLRVQFIESPRKNETR